MIELKCNSCDNKATRYESPFGNPDEAAFCEYHYKRYTDQMHKAVRKLVQSPSNNILNAIHLLGFSRYIHMCIVNKKLLKLHECWSILR